MTSGRMWKVFLGLLIAMILIPVALLVVGGLYLLQQHLFREKVTFLIPAELQGDFRVIYGEACGMEALYDDGRMVLEIPANGVLIIRQTSDDNQRDHKFYLVDKTGQVVEEVPEYSDTKSVMRYEGTMSLMGQDNIVYTNFSIHPPSDTSEHYSIRESERLDSLSKTLLQRCREPMHQQLPAPQSGP